MLQQQMGAPGSLLPIVGVLVLWVTLCRAQRVLQCLQGYVSRCCLAQESIVSNALMHSSISMCLFQWLCCVMVCEPWMQNALVLFCFLYRAVNGETGFISTDLFHCSVEKWDSRARAGGWGKRLLFLLKPPNDACITLGPSTSPCETNGTHKDGAFLLL